MNSSPIKEPIVKRFLDVLSVIAMSMSGVCMVILVVSFGWLVFGRYVLNDTPTWVEQMAMLLVTTITFLGASVGIHQRTHLSVEMLSLVLPEKSMKCVDIFIDLTLFVFGVAMAYYSQELASFAWSRNIPLLGIPDGVRYIPVVTAGILIFLFSSYRVFNGVVALFSSQETVNKSAPKGDK
ncbi:MAG: TRAP transporter small permease [Marinomonas sp.]|uniref:TRAP transporter small permease n=1 Tax=Marinomonas TaxID=28253 RepID=UPI002243D0C7|nr:TRAP transporter small permease [Marinomonas pontica]MCW8355662.1 TRAP transporter small permease [Marinomonas pontica]